MSKAGVWMGSVLVVLEAGVALGHPGHGEDGGSHSVTHYLSDPLHGGGALVVMALVVGVYAWRRGAGRARDRG